MSPRTVAPVVVKPDMDSNSALAGFASVDEGWTGGTRSGRP